jgi:hypothetical protein
MEELTMSDNVTIPAAPGARAVFDDVNDDLLYAENADIETDKTAFGSNAALEDGQPCTLVKLLDIDPDPLWNLWLVKARDGNDYPVFEMEFIVTHAAPIVNDPSAYSAPLL